MKIVWLRMQAHGLHASCHDGGSQSGQRSALFCAIGPVHEHSLLLSVGCGREFGAFLPYPKILGVRGFHAIGFLNTVKVPKWSEIRSASFREKQERLTVCLGPTFTCCGLVANKTLIPCTASILFYVLTFMPAELPRRMDGRGSA